MKIVFLLLSWLFFTPVVHAQEVSPSPEPEKKFSRTIIVQDDLEKPIPNFDLICKQMPKKLEQITENEVIFHELTTNESGEAVLGVSDNTNFIFTCTSKKSTTPDYCWYFPNPTISFDVYEDTEKKQTYLFGWPNFS